MPLADDIRDGIATALASTGLRTVAREGVQVNPDCFRIGYPRPVDRDTFDGSWQWVVPLTLLVKTGSLGAADKVIAPLIGTEAGSVIALLDADPTLGGLVSSATVSGVLDLGLEDLENGGTAAFVQWELDVLTDA